ncbi:heparanase-like protein 2 [Zingiber officinale]|uniref:heparanase-like protein 2 n=1 Tax=Zingiber officinale TaxID=94328 RepID=UPI001C4AE0C9|nr:heparanase-like protein 2 [Zingiber officinale]XP_042461217.1 heparanase-like protein 2 [Zingiber officinale]XP_042461218.1 heparanase-like protein 2 [Zingiber officinale]
MILQFLLSALFLITGISADESPDITVIVRGSDLLAEVDDSFVCATLDWWPPEKCNYNQCPWGQASVLNLNLTHPFLAKAIQAFDPLRIRIGGSLQDKVVYGVPSLESPCLPFSKSTGLFGFSQGCLSLARWDELNLLFEKGGAIITFGLNALNGRDSLDNGMWVGNWNSTNSREFIEYTISKGYQVDSWEFGNELSGRGVGARVSAEQYAQDVIELKALLKELYRDSHTKPILVAPGGFFDQQWYAQLLQDSGLGVVDALTHHVYNLGGGDDSHIESKILNPWYLSQTATDKFRNLQLTIERHGPWSRAWVGEAGGAYNSGNRQVSNKFLYSFWYLDQLGMASKYNTKVYCRQTLIGGNYGLLDTNTFVPNPDYYSALLWHRLMGKGVLSIDMSGSSYLRAYALCAKRKSGITLLLINLSTSIKFSVTVRNDLNVLLAEGGGIQWDNVFIRTLKRTVSWIGRKASDESVHREEYHLTGADGNCLSQTVLLNGNPLELVDGEIPQLVPVYAPANSPVKVDPLSIAFVVFPNFEAQACSS